MRVKRGFWTVEVLASLSLTLILGGVAVAQAFSPRLLPFERQLYAAVVTLLCGYVLLAALYGQATRRKWFDFLLWLSFVGLFAIPMPLQPKIYPGWVAGDLVVLVTPALLVLLGEAFPDLYERRNVLLLCALAGLGAIVATQFQDSSRFGRFEPPKVILFGLAWYALFYASKMSTRLAAAAGVVGLFLLAFHSDVRAAVVLWLITGIIVASTLRSKALAALVGAGLVVLAIDIWLIFGSSVAGAVPESRFGRFDFVSGRTMEVLDVADHFAEHGNPVTYLFGFGFGATFEAKRLIGTVVDDPAVSKRLTGQRTAHVIHFGPARIMFRYGLLGLIVFAIVWTRIATDLVAFATNPVLAQRYPVFFWFLLASICYMSREFLAPMSNSLDFAYVLAGYIVLRRKMWVTSSSSTATKLDIGAVRWKRSASGAPSTVSLLQDRRG